MIDKLNNKIKSDLKEWLPCSMEIVNSYKYIQTFTNELNFSIE